MVYNKGPNNRPTLTDPLSPKPEPEGPPNVFLHLVVDSRIEQVMPGARAGFIVWVSIEQGFGHNGF